MYIPPFLPPPPKRKSWLNRSVDVNSGTLDGWEKSVADSFNGLRAQNQNFVRLLLFSFFLINAEFLMDGQALGQMVVF